MNDRVKNKLDELRRELPNHPFRARLLEKLDAHMAQGNEVTARHIFEVALKHLLREKAGV